MGPERREQLVCGQSISQRMSERGIIPGEKFQNNPTNLTRTTRFHAPQYLLGDDLASDATRHMNKDYLSRQEGVALQT